MDRLSSGVRINELIQANAMSFGDGLTLEPFYIKFVDCRLDERGLHVETVVGDEQRRPMLLTFTFGDLRPGLYDQTTFSQLADSRPALIRSLLLRILEHELDEKLMLNGKHFRDPHPEVRVERPL